MRKLYSSAFAIEGIPIAKYLQRCWGRGDGWGGDEQEKGWLMVGREGGGRGRKDWGNV